MHQPDCGADGARMVLVCQAEGFRLRGCASLTLTLIRRRRAIAFSSPVDHNSPYFDMVLTVHTYFESGLRRTPCAASRCHALP